MDFLRHRSAPSGVSSHRLAVACIAMATVALCASTVGAEGLRTPGHPTGRFDLGLGQGWHGLILGTEICDAADVRPEGVCTLIGGTVGAVLGLALGDVDMGHAMMVNHGTALGALHAAILMEWQDDPDSWRTQDEELAWLATGQLTGTLAGALIGSAVAHEPGRAGLAGSMAIWAMFLGGMSRWRVGADFYHPGYLALVDLSYVAGWLLWEKWPISRTQALLIDLAGVGGLMIGASWAESGGWDDPDTPVDEEWTAILLATTGALAAAAGLVNLVGASGRIEPTVAFVPAHGGGRLSVSFEW